MGNKMSEKETNDILKRDVEELKGKMRALEGEVFEFYTDMKRYFNEETQKFDTYKICYLDKYKFYKGLSDMGFITDAYIQEKSAAFTHAVTKGLKKYASYVAVGVVVYLTTLLF